MIRGLSKKVDWTSFFYLGRRWMGAMAFDGWYAMSSPSPPTR